MNVFALKEAIHYLISWKWKVKVKVTLSRSTLCNPWTIYSPWNSPGQNTGVGSLLQGIFPTQGRNPGFLHCRQILFQLSHQGSPRILESAAYPFSSGSSRPRSQTCIAGRFFTNWAIREAPINFLGLGKKVRCFWRNYFLRETSFIWYPKENMTSSVHFRNWRWSSDRENLHFSRRHRWKVLSSYWEGNKVLRSESLPKSDRNSTVAPQQETGLRFIPFNMLQSLRGVGAHVPLFPL